VLAPIGTRPEVAAQLVREYIYLYGAVSPKDGTCVYLIMPTSNGRCWLHTDREPPAAQAECSPAVGLAAAFVAARAIAPAGNCSTVARWPSHSRVSSTTWPSGNSNAS
jgi:hypothetical protein